MTVLINAKAAKRNFLVSAAGISGYFTTDSGGEPTSTAVKQFDGGSLIPYLLVGPPEISDLTCTRLYDPVADAGLVNALMANVGTTQYTIAVQPTDVNLAPTGTAWNYVGVLTKVSPPMADSGSGDAATLQLTFAIASVA